MNRRYPALLREIWVGMSAHQVVARSTRILALFAVVLLLVMSLFFSRLSQASGIEFLIGALMLDVFITACITPLVLAITSAWELGARVDQALEDARRLHREGAAEYGFHRGTWSLAEEPNGTAGRLSDDSRGRITSPSID